MPMAIPDWTVDLLRRQITEVAEQLKKPETMQQMRDRATEFLHDLPQAATRVWDQAREGIEPSHRRSRPAPIGMEVLNATGNYCGGAVARGPIASAAVEAARDAWGSFRSDRESVPAWWKKVASRVAKSVGGERLLIANGTESALVALASFAKDQQATVFVPRCCAMRLSSGLAIPDVLASAGAKVVEVGSSEAVAVTNWQRVQPAKGDIVIVAGDAQAFELPDADRGCLIVSVVQDVTLRPLQHGVAPVPPSVGEHLAGPTDLVITSGARLMGGPDCGLLFGDQRTLDAIESTPLWHAVEASLELRAMLLVALEEPLLLTQLLSTSLENLRHRAQNLATRLAAASETDGGKIRLCTVSDHPARLIAGAPYEVASQQLRLQHTERSASEWADELANQTPAVLVTVDEDVLLVDLRWIDVNQDESLVTALAGSPILENPDVP